MKKLFIYFLILSLLFSCNEEISRDITTDLSMEADQFFDFSTAINEGGYLGNFSYPDYFRTQSQSLPGCPKIEIDQTLRIVTLDYDAVDSCTQEKTLKRKGKIRLDFSQSNTQIGTWWMEYIDYHFENTEIKGKREFKALTTSQNQEKFENLRFNRDTGLSFVANGTNTYFVSRFSFRPFAISFVGKIEGTNPAGRKFSQTLTKAKEVYINCYSEGWILPFEGEETWTVERGQGRELTYRFNFSSEGQCEPIVNALLPDGRNLILNP
ncbi:hypothetical protein Aoki45_16220 [Algoriphagus sp. oki45]|uniref:hypothetical protein n=1 Tax=Algoriphagus sp. oki45 TaxID=3067294 RepID=UPI0027EE3FE2|nr:hypothetical protein Aoki45_16220 [Algoriphagus sp. oki45]